MQVLAFKVVSGEEIIGDVQTISDSELRVKNPMVVSVQPAGDGRVGVGLFPYSFASRGAISFKASALVTYPYSPAPEFERNYMQQSSGLDLSATGIL